MYIPGETIEHDKARKMLIDNGGLLCLLVISQYALEQDIREHP